MMYTDDILLYRPIRQASDYQLLQPDGEALRKWVINNYLTFNPLKSKAVVFPKRDILLGCVNGVSLFTGLDYWTDLFVTKNHFNAL